MDQLYKGIHQFQSTYFRNESEFFKRLSQGQHPDVLFITCADSRVDPNLVTQSRPGELFIVRNVGNIVPPCNAIKDKNSVAAALEFAVLGLKVRDIIVCGHSNCGAMELLQKHEGFFLDMPHLKEWIAVAEPLRRILGKHYPDVQGEARARTMERENVLLQIRNLESYPFVERALERGVLKLHGWYYDIGTGQITSYVPDTDRFENVLQL
jgi:carbonic anhydrase